MYLLRLRSLQEMLYKNSSKILVANYGTSGLLAAALMEVITDVSIRQNDFII